MPRVLHVLSQRPGRTGSGVTLDALVRGAAEAGWRQAVVVGVPAGETVEVADLPPDSLFPLTFGGGDVSYPVPGMSDVMPYPSTRFSSMSPSMLGEYREAWRRHLLEVIATFQPDLIHAHHVWLLGAMLKDVAPHVPVVTHCHSTGLRQMDSCPGLVGEVVSGCARNERFVVLHEGQAADLSRLLGVEATRVRVVGAGYREDLFHTAVRRAHAPPRLAYVGKISEAKGVPSLLDAFEGVSARRPEVELHVAGSGAGEETPDLEKRMLGMAPRVVLHGALSQANLAELLRECRVCVLPSFYEGVPLVLVEALACGCRLVATELPGVSRHLAPKLGPALEMVTLPRLVGIDAPEPADLPAFVERLRAAIERTLELPDLGDPSRTLPGVLQSFAWPAVFRRVEEVWRESLGE